MKSVLISIQPKWCEKIANCEKTIEVRKTKPKLDTPFKAYIYCTKPKYEHEDHITLFSAQRCFYAGSKVIGEFVCDEIITAECGCYCKLKSSETLLNALDLMDYADGKTVYGWHISDLVIYDTPKELSEFRHCGDNYHFNPIITKPPQSWCYVEEGADNDR